MKVKFFLLSFFLYFFPLIAEDAYTPSPASVIATLEGDPVCSIEEVANAVSGETFVSQIDMVVQGIEPIIISRVYASGKANDGFGGWELFPDNIAYYAYNREKKRSFAIISEKSGIRYAYKSEKGTRSPLKIDKKLHKASYTNTGSLAGGRSNFRNNVVHMAKDRSFLELHAADGSIRHYFRTLVQREAYKLKWERTPRGNYIEYKYDENYRIIEIISKNPARDKVYAWVKVLWHGKCGDNINCTLQSSDGRTVEYYYKKNTVRDFLGHFKEIKLLIDFYALEKVRFSWKPEENLDYHERTYGSRFLLGKRNFSKGRSYMAAYYQAGGDEVGGIHINVGKKNDPREHRVKILAAPVGHSDELITTHQFIYHIGKRAENGTLEKDGTAIVKDVHGNTNVYEFTKDFHPTCIKTEANIGPDGSRGYFSARRYWWHKGNRYQTAYYDKDQVFLAKKQVIGANGCLYAEEVFGNITGLSPEPVEICGQFNNILKHKESWEKKYTYTEQYLLKEEISSNGITYRYAYLPEVELMTAKYTLFEGQIKKREFYLYNQDLVCIREIIDDGSSLDRENLTDVTQKYIKEITLKQNAPAHNFPKIITEKYLDLATGQQRQIRKEVLSYNKFCQVIRREI
ncbi:MAG: hypothetical protein Tsb0015_08490 [Simkaniaceae bacterium]